MRPSCAAVAFLALAGCVSLEQLPPGSVPGAGATSTDSAVTTFPDLDPGATQLSSLHFSIRGYTENQIRPISVLAESLYDKIGRDTGLYSFLASGSYNLIVYRDRDEYLQKTRQPTWSRAATLGTTIYLYPGSDLEPVLAHEMCHLIFNSYMGLDKAKTFRWINEGLAVFEELSRMGEGDRSVYRSEAMKNLRERRLAFTQMTFFVPATEEKRLVDVWYQQVQSVVAFLLSQGSALNFANMLNSLKSGADIDKAVADAYPGKFRSLGEVENSWKFTV